MTFSFLPNMCSEKCPSISSKLVNLYPGFSDLRPIPIKSNLIRVISDYVILLVSTKIFPIESNYILVSLIANQDSNLIPLMVVKQTRLFSFMPPQELKATIAFQFNGRTKAFQFNDSSGFPRNQGF